MGGKGGPMSDSRANTFLARRLSRDHWLGLHLTLGVPLMAALLAAFVVLAAEVRAGTTQTFDDEVGRTLQAQRQATPLLRVGLMAFTLVGAFETMVLFVPLVLVLLWRGKRKPLALVWLVCGIGVGILNQVLKTLFDRDRPEFKDAWVYESNKSFPSGHAMGATAIFGLLAVILVLSLPGRRAKMAAVAGMALLILVIGFSRVYLGAHYTTDVLAGFLLGAAWLTACLIAARTLHLRDVQK
jgi:undecaprenyl-diphosphatase